MHQTGVRYTVHTNEDVEALDLKWAFQYGALVLDGVQGYYEASIVDEIPADLQDVFKSTAQARVVYRNEFGLGDLFYHDAMPGTTIELHDNKHASDSTKGVVESIKFMEVLTGKKLETTDTGESALIQVLGTKVYYDVEPPSAAFLNYLVERWPDVRTHMYGASMVEFIVDQDAERLHIRLVSEIPQTLKLPESTEFGRTEVGIVQRQKRHLQDSEFKGLSAFLPAKDLSPFMIFFDQRLRPLATENIGHSTVIDGKGSHLAYHSQLRPGERIETHCRLYSEYRLPKEYFFDPYELQNLYPNKTQLYGEQDLEAPVWKVAGWGSILYVDLEDTPAELRIPFHARYFESNTDARPRRTRIMAPQVFKACLQADQAFVDNPWDSGTIKSKVLGENNYYRLLPNTGKQSFEVYGTVADARYEGLVMWTTSLAILLGFCYVVLRMAFSSQSGARNKMTIHKKVV